MLRVVTWKWGSGIVHKKRIKFEARHVNILAMMVKRNLSLEHEFVCITDNPKGLAEDIRVIPLWDGGLRELKGCYVRLKMFSKDMAEVIGPRFLSLDLDCVIMGDITPLVDRKDDFIIWGEDDRIKAPYCASMMLMDAGSRAWVWEKFDPKVVKTGGRMRRIWGYGGSDQSYLNACLYPKEKTWTRKDGVYNFSPDIVERYDGKLPDNARIVFFNGGHDPSIPIYRNRYVWIREHWHA